MKFIIQVHKAQESKISEALEQLEDETILRIKSEKLRRKAEFEIEDLNNQLGSLAMRKKRNTLTLTLLYFADALEEENANLKLELENAKNQVAQEIEAQETTEKTIEKFSRALDEIRAKLDEKVILQTNEEKYVCCNLQ